MPHGTLAPSIETRQSWTIAFVGVAMLALAAGAPMIVVIGLVPISETLGTGRSVPSFATTLAYVGTGLGGVVCGLMAARFGQRAVAMLGGAALCSGLALASTGHGWSLLAGIGLGVGLFGNGALFPPMVAYVSLWFDRRRGTAVALVSSGQYVAGALWPFVFERTIVLFGWQATMLGYGIFAAATVMALALLLAPPPVPIGGPARMRTGAALRSSACAPTPRWR